MTFTATKLPLQSTKTLQFVKQWRDSTHKSCLRKTFAETNRSFSIKFFRLVDSHNYLAIFIRFKVILFNCRNLVLQTATHHNITITGCNPSLQQFPSRKCFMFIAIETNIKFLIAKPTRFFCLCILRSNGGFLIFEEIYSFDNLPWILFFQWGQIRADFGLSLWEGLKFGKLKIQCPFLVVYVDKS